MTKDSLFSRASKAAAWGYAGTALKLVLQLGVQVYMARILGPGEYGLFAIGVVVVAFALYFGDVASSALIPRKELSGEQIRFAFTWQILASCGVALCLFLSSNAIAAYTGEPRAVGVVRALSSICVLNALGGVSLALLRRDLSYKTIQIAQVSGYVVGYVLVGMAWVTFLQASVWALVAAWLAQVLVTSIWLLCACPHSMRPRFACADGAELLKFGWSSLVSNLGTWAMSNVDRVIVARYFPAVQVGLYTTSANLLATPLSQLYATFQSVAFSASSRLDENPGQISHAFSTLMAVVVLCAGLVYGTSFVAADVIVLNLYGEAWSEAVPFVRVFSFVMFCNALSGSITPLLWGRGRIGVEAKLQAFTAVLLVVGSLLFISHSAVAVAIWVAVCMALRCGVLLCLAWDSFLQREATGFAPVLKMLLFVSCFVIVFAVLRVALAGAEGRILGLFLIVGLPLLALLVVFKFSVWFGAHFSRLANSMALRLPLIGRYLV